MKIDSLKLIHAFDRDDGSRLCVNGTEIGSVNYDEHGSAGSELFETIAKNLSDLLDLKLEVDEVESFLKGKCDGY